MRTPRYLTKFLVSKEVDLMLSVVDSGSCPFKTNADFVGCITRPEACEKANSETQCRGDASDREGK